MPTSPRKRLRFILRLRTAREGCPYKCLQKIRRDAAPSVSAGIDIYNDKFAVPIVSPFQFIFYTI